MGTLKDIATTDSPPEHMCCALVYVAAELVCTRDAK